MAEVLLDLIINHDCSVLVQKITENLDYYKDKLGEKQWRINEYEQITSQAKQLEWLASRYCVLDICQRWSIQYDGLTKDEHNKPYLIGTDFHVSLTHTKDTVAAGIHFKKPLGIDLETITERLHIIKHKFLTDIERSFAADAVERLCLLWSAKEAMYKLYGKRGLHFKEQLNIDAFDYPAVMKTTGIINAENIMQTVQLTFFKIDQQFLTIAI